MPKEDTKKFEESGIALNLGGGSFDVAALRKATTDSALDIKDEAKRDAKLAKAQEEAQNPVEVSYQKEPIVPNRDAPAVFDGHELKEVENAAGEKVTINVPIAADELEDSSAPADQVVSGGAAAIAADTGSTGTAGTGN